MSVISALRALPAAVSLGAVLCLAGCGAQAAGGGRAEAAPAPTPLTVSPPFDRPHHVEADSSPASPPPACPDSGLLLSAGPANAALGLRVQTVVLTNCGHRVRKVGGYPGVRLLDEDGDPLKVKIDPGARRVTTAVKDPGPKPLAVRPGRSARFSLVWRNTYDDTSRPPAVGATVIVTAGPGGSERRISGLIDLGSTGRLGVTAWEEVPAGTR
ncbi:DUF4232 domain-containing protein [Streptosporangium canum]|uniref:DUF4232 domain-containing protein n=1 Tax=Streptosporangium canum TaxID=324952 RepID=UPI0034376D38